MTFFSKLIISDQCVLQEENKIAQFATTLSTQQLNAYAV